jgi:hypothetical protein
MKTKIPSVEIPKGQIRWLVGKLHVSTTDEQVIEDFTNRCDKSPDKITASQKKRIIEYALKEHHANQSLFNSVMSGRF